MIISRTPLRISFAGGGTDIKSYYAYNNFGHVISCGINKYIYVAIKKQSLISDYKYRIKWDKIENCNSIDKIKHPIIKAALKYFNIEDSLEIITFSDVPIGTGLGSSSTFTVGLVNALLAYLGRRATKGQMADLASKIEIDILKRNIGKQDHYAASYGKLHEYIFKNDESVEVHPVISNSKIFNEIESRCSLYYTHQKRDASKILNSVNVNKKFNILTAQKKQVTGYIDIFCGKKNINYFGKYLHEGWLLKKLTSKSISNKNIDLNYKKAMSLGATGGKILGAGGGGFLLLFSPINKINKIENNLKNYQKIDFKFESSGTRITYFD